MEVKGSTQTRETKTKVRETAGIKTKVTRTKVPETKTTKVTETKITKTATKETPVLRATKVVAEGFKVKTLEGVDTTRPKGITTRATAPQTNKVHMILMLIHLMSLTTHITTWTLGHDSLGTILGNVTRERCMTT